MGIKSFAKHSAVLGLRGGGQIASGVLQEYLDQGMIKLYTDSRMLRLSVFIDEEADVVYYTVPDVAVTSIEDSSKLIQINRVSYTDPATPTQATINSSRVLGKYQYSFKSTVSSGAISRSLYLHYVPGMTVLSGLEIVRACSSKLDDFVPEEMLTDAREALTALIKHNLLSETGKPWTEPNLAAQEMGKYMAHMGKIKIAAETDFTQRDLTAHSAVPFII